MRRPTELVPLDREDVSGNSELPAVKPPESEQAEHGANKQSKLPLCSEGASLSPLTGDERVRGGALLFEFAGDPVVSDIESVFERNGGLPIQDFPQTRVVAVAASDALRFRQIVTLANLLAGDVCNDVYELVDGDHPVLTEIDRLAMIAIHQTIDTFDTIVDVTVRARLFAVAPNFDIVAVFSECDLAADRGRRFFAATVVGA
jgi:hypothetical protein